MMQFDTKIKHYNLNLFYSRHLDLTAETNFLIQKIFNEFQNNYAQFAKTHTFVFEYQDDILSLICYRMLQSIFSLNEIPLILYGKHKLTKKFLVKKQKFYSKWKVEKLIKKGKIVYITSFNPLYQVVQNNKNFKHFELNKWMPLKDFTYYNLKEARVFYHIGYIKNDIIEDNRGYLFNKWCDLIVNKNNIEQWCAAAPEFIDDDYFDNIHLIQLSENLKENEEILQEIQNEKGIFIYDLDTIKNREEVIKQLINFSFYIQNSSNTYGYFNDKKDIDPYQLAEYTNQKVIIHKYKGEI